MREIEPKQNMSTNTKKLYIPKDIKLAQEKNIRIRKYFTRKTSKRRTVQIRISEEWHQEIKIIAGEEKIMLSFMLDEICRFFFKNYK